MKKVLFALCFLTIVFSTTNTAVGAVRKTMLNKGEGVLAAMKRMECKPGWLSVVLRTSNILESELNMLPIGTKIKAPDECASGLPDREAVAITRRILINQEALRRVPELEKSNEDFQVEVGRLRQDLLQKEDILKVYRKQAEYDRLELERIKRLPPPPPSSLYTFVSMLAGAAWAFISLVAAWLVDLRYRVAWSWRRV